MQVRVTMMLLLLLTFLAATAALQPLSRQQLLQAALNPRTKPDIEGERLVELFGAENIT